MTDAEWFEYDDDTVDAAFDGLSPRRQRLLAASAARALTAVLDYPGVRAALDTAETFADTGESKAALRRACRAVEADRLALVPGSVPLLGCVEEALSVFELVASERAVRDTLFSVLAVYGCLNRCGHRRAQERVLPFVREVLGPPRPVAFDPAWRTDWVVTFARQLYESRAFDTMPVLGHALRAAGCEDETILNHCRDTSQPHVRGCWVVDLVLGKEWPYSVPRK